MQKKYGSIYFFVSQEEALNASSKKKERDIYVYPGSSTQECIDYFNDYLMENDLCDKLSEYYLSYPITLEDIIYKPENIYYCTGNLYYHLFFGFEK